MTAAIQVCYVVAGNGWDRHSQMAWVSASSVRRQEPRARIVVVFEGSTPDAAEVVRTRFSGLADVLVKESGEHVPVHRNRVHRIQLREYVRGDFLYLDSDTLAVAPFADVLTHQGDVGAVIDCNNSFSSGRFPPDFEVPFKQHGWDYPLPHYLNSGVVLMRDTKGASDFCGEWLKRWRAQERTALTLHRDQAAFNSAFFASPITRAILPHRYNCMVVKRNHPFRDSSIVHFFGTSEEQRGTLMEHLVQHVDATGEFDTDAYERSLRQQHPWGPNPEPWQLYQSRNYVRAAVVKTRALIRSRP